AGPQPPSGGCGPAVLRGPILVLMYFTDRGIEELEKRRGEEEVTFEWLAEQLRTFVDLNPDFEVPVERLATWLARPDYEDDEWAAGRRPRLVPPRCPPAHRAAGAGRRCAAQRCPC